MGISRDYCWLQASLTSSLATTAIVPMAGYAYGEIYIPTGSSITSLTYYACPHPPGTDVDVKSYTTDRFDAAQQHVKAGLSSLKEIIGFFRSVAQLDNGHGAALRKAARAAALNDPAKSYNAQLMERK